MIKFTIVDQETHRHLRTFESVWTFSVQVVSLAINNDKKKVKVSKGMSCKGICDLLP